MFLELADAKGHGCDGYEAGDKSVGDEDKKGYPVIFDLESFVDKGPYDLDEEEERDDGADGGQ